MKTYLCSEFGEHFLIRARNITDARNSAILWGAEVIGEYDKVTNSLKIM